MFIGDFMEQLNRSELRKKIMTILYQINIYEKNKIKFDVDSVIKEVCEIDNEFVKDMVYGVITYKNDIDNLANKYLNNWKIYILSKVYKAILSLGIYELLYTKTPSIVAINEAIELSKKYSDEDVTKMINACLDKIYHEELKEEK